MLVATATELPRLMACIGSRLMPAALPPDHDHEARDEGNAAHWLAMQAFRGIPVAPGQKAYNGYVITDEMMDHVKTYLDALDCGEMEIDTTWNGMLDQSLFEVRGRADHVIYRSGLLTVDDFKYGWRLVSPVLNWTLMSHAIGWISRYGCNATDQFAFRIHQPRPYHSDGPVREWRISYDELRHYWHEIINRLGNPSDQLTTSDQCAKCHALATCPAARSASMNAIDATGLAFSDDLPDNVLTFELETLRHAKATIENRFDALEELLTHKIQQGGVVPGYALKQRLAKRAWLPGLDANAVSIMTGKDLTKAGFVTPAEAKRRGVSDDVIEKLTNRAFIGTKLERIDADAEARKRFG